MDASSNLVKLKLDMVYRDLSMETASARFTESTRPEPLATDAAPVAVPAAPKQRKKRMIKVAVPSPAAAAPAVPKKKAVKVATS